MTNENVIPFPGERAEEQKALNRRRAMNIKERFRSAGRAQPQVFEALSRRVEKLVAKAKSRLGEKSGAMQAAFGEELVRQKGRYCARDGEPPKTVCKTPGNWIRVLEGFAKVLGQDPDLLVSQALEEAMMAPEVTSGIGQEAWLIELDGLLEPLAERLRSEADMPAIADDVARSGLYLEDGRLEVSEWPAEIGVSPGRLYAPHALGLIPHLFGLNFELITEQGLDLSDPEQAQAAQELLSANRVDLSAYPGMSQLEAVEGTRIGLAFAVETGSHKADLALIEWQVATLTLKGPDHEVMAKLPANSGHPVKGQLSAHPVAMFEPEWEDDVRQRPPHWQPNSVRFHFRGSTGFDRLLGSLLVEPWVWSDPEEWPEVFFPDPRDTEAHPVASPVHTVAAQIESSLRYADEHGHPDHRIDRMLAAEIRRVRDLVMGFRTVHAARRQSTREQLVAEWKAEAERNLAAPEGGA